MSDVSQGPGWWQASDGKWYPPEQASAQPPATGGPSGAPPAGQAPTGPPPSGPPAGFGSAPGGPPAYGAQGASAQGGGAGAGQLAEWPERALGGLIDYFGIGILAGIFAQFSFGLGSLLSLLALAWAIYNAYLNGTTGRSVGKKIVGLKVVSEETGQPIGGGQGIIRYLAHFIDAIICYIGFLFPLWDAKKQTIADKIIKTVVLTGEPKVPFAEAIKPD